MNATPLILDITVNAQTDITEIGFYFAERDQEVKQRFYQAIDQTILTLARSPYLGERCSFRNPKTTGMRIWQVYGFSNYLIFYRPQNERLEVLRVLHGARDYTTIFNEK